MFEDMNKDELSMIEVAHAILEQRGDVMDFSDLVNQIQNYLGKTDSDIRESLAQFYTDLNIDGSFISLGDNRWGLRSWYPIDSIDEEVTSTDDDDEDTPRRKKRKKVNAFIADVNDEDAIDYNDDDPEDADLTDEDDDDDLYDDDDEEEEISEYNSELQEIGAEDISDDEEDIPGNIEEDLTIIEDDDEDDEDDDYEEDDLL